MAKRGGIIGPTQGQIPFDAVDQQGHQVYIKPVTKAPTPDYSYRPTALERACAVVRAVGEKHTIGGLVHINIAVILQEVVALMNGRPNAVATIKDGLRRNFLTIFSYATQEEKAEIKKAFTGIPYADEVLQEL